MKGIPCVHHIKVLSEPQLEMIHEATLSLLERTGIRVDSEGARSRFLRAGASLHDSRKSVVRFPRSLIEDAITRVPRRIVYHARDPEWDIEYDGEHMFPYAGGGDPKMIDLDTGRVRPSTYSDIETAVRLGESLEHCRLAANIVEPTDVPPELSSVKTVEAALRNSVKPVSSHAFNGPTVDFIARMGACIAGGEEEFRKRPIIQLAGSPSSPLTYSEHMCETLMRSAELGIPYSIVPCPICGATGPMTLSGSLAQQNAELLSGLVLLQSIDANLPTVYSGRVCVMDPRSGKDLWGIPEQCVATVAMVQLARRYRMVSDVCGMTSDVAGWGLQMGLERMMTVLFPVLAGAESMSGIGGGWEGASSLEAMVIDNEIMNDVARLVRGIEVDEARLGLDVIDNVGHMGNFLAQRHTMEYLRRGEYRASGLWDKRTSQAVAREGSRSLLDVARERVRTILKEQTPKPLERDVERALSQVVKEAQRTLVR